MVWFKDFELPQPFTTNENAAKKSSRAIISKSKPIKPSGSLPDRSIEKPICINSNTAKMRGKEMVPVNANAEIKGIVTI